MSAAPTDLKRILGARPLGVPFLAVAALCLFAYLMVDRRLALWLHDSVTPLIHEVFRAITMAGDATPYVVICLGIMGAAYYKARRPGAIPARDILLKGWFFLSTLVLSGAIHHVMKIVIGRYRPRYLFRDDLYGVSPFNFDISMNGFPSGHSQTAWSVAACLMIMFPRFWPLILPLVILVSLSRLIVGAHYLSDVVFGGYLAVATAILLWRYYFTPRFERLSEAP